MNGGSNLLQGSDRNERDGEHGMTMRSFISKVGTFYYYLRNLKNWREVTQLHTRGKTVETLRLRNGKVVHLLDSKAEIRAYLSIFRERCYDHDFPGIPRDGTVLDLGANVGLFVVHAALRVVPAGKVFAVEANPDCCDVLEKNVLDNKLEDRVVLFRNAIASSPGETTLWLAEDTLSASVFRSSQARTRLTVSCITLEQLLNLAGRVDLLKANIEGAEYPLFYDSEEKVWHQVIRLAIKYHTGELGNGRTPEMLAEKIRSLGYKIVRHETIWQAEWGSTGIITATRR